MKVRHDVDATTMKRKVRRVVAAATLTAAVLAPMAMPATAHAAFSSDKALHSPCWGKGC